MAEGDPGYSAYAPAQPEPHGVATSKDCGPYVTVCAFQFTLAITVDLPRAGARGNVDGWKHVNEFCIDICTIIVAT